MIITSQDNLVKAQDFYVQEFLNIFSSRWNYIVSKMPESIVDKTSWRTVNKNTYRYLRDVDELFRTLRPKLEDEELYKIWKSPDFLLGLGFDKETRYLILDIDAGSIYHPNSGKGLEAIKESLEDIGLVSPLMMQSSHSSGLHVYYPLPKPVKSFALGLTITSYLIEKGFTVADGTLEIFPNQKKKTSIYKRCRLPLQKGSFILDGDYQIVGNSLEEFIKRFEFSAKKQDIKLLEVTISQYQKEFYSRKKFTNQAQNHTGKLQEMSLEYETLLKKGFLRSGQTNQILMFLSRVGRLVERLAGQDLYNFILKNITNLPNYQKHCNHQKEIHQRCLDVARCTERHYPLTVRKEDIKPLPEPKENNQAKWDDATKRIKAALDLIRKNKETFDCKTHLLHRIVELAHCSFTTIKKRWNDIKEIVALILKPRTDSLNTLKEKKCTITHKERNSSIKEHFEKESTISKTVCNPRNHNTSSDFEKESTISKTVCNPRNHNTSSDFENSLYTKVLPFVSSRDFLSQRDLLHRKKMETDLEIKKLLERLRQMKNKMFS